MEECTQVEPSIPIPQNRAVDHCEFLSSTQEVAYRINQAASELPKKRRTRDDEPALPSIEGRMNRRVLRSRYRAVRIIIKGPFSPSPSSSRECARLFFFQKKKILTLMIFCRGT